MLKRGSYVTKSNTWTLKGCQTPNLSLKFILPWESILTATLRNVDPCAPLFTSSSSSWWIMHTGSCPHPPGIFVLSGIWGNYSGDCCHIPIHFRSAWLTPPPPNFIQNQLWGTQTSVHPPPLSKTHTHHIYWCFWRKPVQANCCVGVIILWVQVSAPVLKWEEKTWNSTSYCLSTTV